MVDLSSVWTREETLWPPIYFPVHRSPSDKGSTLKAMNLLPLQADLNLRWAHISHDTFSDVAVHLPTAIF